MCFCKQTHSKVSKKEIQALVYSFQNIIFIKNYKKEVEDGNKNKISAIFFL